jgi:hypothetical protein
MRDRDHVRYMANNLAWFAAVNPWIPITCALHRVGRSGARLAMSSPCLYAEGTIARCIAVAMKPRGGRKPGLIRPLRSSVVVRYSPRQRLFRRCFRPMTRLNSWQLRPLKTNMV